MRVVFDTKRLRVVLTRDDHVQVYTGFLAPDAVIDVDGVKISLELLATLANPDPRVAYRMKRNADNVTVVKAVTGQP